MSIADRVEKLISYNNGSYTDSNIDNDYQEIFANEGERKAQYIIDDLLLRSKKADVSLSKFAYLCIGAADGSELEAILMKTNICHAIMIEFSDVAAKKARIRSDRLKEKGKILTVITGDANQKLDTAIAHLEDLKKMKGIRGLVLSMQAIIHELPKRSPNFELPIFLGRCFSIFKNNAFYGREPIAPTDWPDTVEMLIPGVEGARIAVLSCIIKEKLNISGRKPTPVGPKNHVNMSSPLALEVLHKLLRSRSVSEFTYELGEQLTSVDPKKLQKLVEKDLGVGSTQIETFITEGFEDAWKSHKVEVRTPEGDWLSIPNTHARIMAFSITQKDSLSEMKAKSEDSETGTGSENLEFPVKNIETLIATSNPNFLIGREKNVNRPKEKTKIFGSQKARKVLDEFFEKYSRREVCEPLILIGEEGTGKSLLIDLNIRKLPSYPKLIRVSGSSFKSDYERQIIIHILAKLFDEDPNYDGRVIEKVCEFCDQSKLIQAKNLCYWLQTNLVEFGKSKIPLGSEEEHSFEDFEASTDFPGEKKKPKFFSKNVLYSPYSYLWSILKAKIQGFENGVIIWLEDAQFFPDHAEIVGEFFRYADEGTPNLLLIGEFRAERQRDVARYKEKYQRSSRIAVCEEFSKEEIREFIAYKTDTNIRGIPHQLINDIYLASGGNPKFTVDWFSYLMSLQVVKTNSEDAILEYHPRSNLTAPRELKELKKQQFREQEFSQLELEILFFLAVSPDLIQKAEILTVIFGQNTSQALTRLIKDVGILNEVDEDFSLWLVQFEHLTSKEACLELLKERDDRFKEELFEKVKQGRKNLREIEKNQKGSRQTKNWRGLNPIVRELAFISNNSEGLAEEIIFSVAFSRSKDLEKLKEWGGLFRRHFGLSPNASILKEFIFARINDIEKKSEDIAEKYFEIASKFQLLNIGKDILFSDGFIDLIRVAFERYLKYQPEETKTVAEHMIKFRNFYFQKTNAVDYPEFSRRFFMKFFLTISCEKIKKEQLFTCFRDANSGAILNDISTIFLIFHARNCLQNEEEIFNDPFLNSDFDLIIKELGVRAAQFSSEGNAGEEYTISWVYDMGVRTALKRVLAFQTKFDLSVQEYDGAINCFKSQIESLEQLAPAGTFLFSKLNHTAILISFSRLLSKLGHFSKAREILAGLKPNSITETIKLEIEQIRLELHETGNFHAFAQNFLAIVEGLDSLKEIQPRDAWEIIRIMQSISPRNHDGENKFLDLWFGEISNENQTLSDLTSFVSDLADMGFSPSRFFPILRKHFSRNALEIILVDTNEQLVLQKEEMLDKNSQNNAKTRFAKLHEIFERDFQFLSRKNKSVLKIVVFSMFTVGEYIDFKYNKTEFRQLCHAMETIKDFEEVETDEAYWTMRWDLFGKGALVEQGIKECESFLHSSDHFLSEEVLWEYSTKFSVANKVWKGVYPQIKSNVQEGRKSLQKWVELDDSWYALTFWGEHLSVFSPNNTEEFFSILDERIEAAYLKKQNSLTGELLRVKTSSLFSSGKFQEAYLASKEREKILLRTFPIDWKKKLLLSNNLAFLEMAMNVENPDCLRKYPLKFSEILQEQVLHNECDEVQFLVTRYNKVCSEFLLGEFQEAGATLQQLLYEPKNEDIVNTSCLLVVFRLDESKPKGAIIREGITLWRAIGIASFWISKALGKFVSFTEWGKKFWNKKNSYPFESLLEAQFFLEIFQELKYKPDGSFLDATKSDFPQLTELIQSFSAVTVEANIAERNATCPCGSGKKYKKCCGNK